MSRNVYKRELVTKSSVTGNTNVIYPVTTLDSVIDEGTGRPLNAILEQLDIVEPVKPNRVEPSYDAKGRLTGIKELRDGHVLRLTELTYNDAGLIGTSKETANGQIKTSTFQYDENGMIVAVDESIADVV